jgi:hypothetical protein
MKRTTITLAALLAALVPAGIGLWGNASFSQAVPVRVPASAQVVTPTAPATTTATTVDDHGGDTPRDQRTEPGDDRDSGSGASGSGSDDSSTASGSGSGSGSDDSSGSSGSGRSGSDSSGSGSSGHSGGSDDSGSDDHGGHGSDD